MEHAFTLFSKVELTKVDTDQLTGPHAVVESSFYMENGSFTFVEEVYGKGGCECRGNAPVVVVNHFVPDDKVCWGAWSNCKGIGKARTDSYASHIFGLPGGWVRETLRVPSFSLRRLLASARLPV
eukprot:1139669-Pelagomonas_calceolata.AAC.2